jgi:putative salt-induced outer membrane protein YdiY
LPDDVAPAPPGSKPPQPPAPKAAGESSPAVDAKKASDAADAASGAGSGPTPAEVKSLPLLDPFPSWLQFGDFNAAKLWSGTIQLGLNGAEGNAITFNIASGYDLKRETKFLVLTSDLKYNKATSRLVETQHNAIFNGKSEWLFQESPWTAFARGYLEYDEFKAFDLRVVTNAGAGYRLINRDKSKLTSRFGSGFSHEIGGPDDSYVPEAVFGMDFSHQFTPRQKFNAKGDYFPEWGEFTNYRIVTSADWELLFDQVANLSLKLGITDRYDSSPNGLKPNDFTYSTLILWKL